MGQFITGLLESNADHATYEGVVYDRYLTLCAAGGPVLSVFDMVAPISTGLPTGRVYELVLLAAVPGELKVGSSPAPDVGQGGWQGTVVDPCWRAEGERYSTARPELFDTEWVLVETLLGQLVVRPDEFDTPVSRGTPVQWNGSRLDLYAIV